MVTFAVLPYLWGRTLVWTLIVGRPDPRFAALTVVAILGVMILTWGVRTPGRGVGTFLGWVLANSILIGVYAVPQMPLWQLLIVFVASTVWVVWLAWIGAWPLRWPTRLALLALWLGLGALGPCLIRVEGMMGDTGMIFAWRHSTKPTLALPSSEAAATVIDLTPTPNDFPQFLGPHRTGVLPNAKIAGDWTKTPPREVWRRPIGQGWGSFAIVGNYAFTQEQRGEKECVCCYRLSDGAPMWVHEDTARFEGLGGVGPGATPTVTRNGRVYAIGNTGILNCLDGTTGRLTWTVNILADVGAKKVASHGTCASPLLNGAHIVVCPTGTGGPSLAAYSCGNGQRLWAMGTEQASYSSPMMVLLEAQGQILLGNAAGLTAHDFGTGKVLWHFPWTNSEHINVAQPIVLRASNQVFFSTGYGKGSAVIQLKAARVEEGVLGEVGPWMVETLWENSRAMKTKFTTPVLHGDYVYGLDDGILECIDPRTGKVKWKDGRYGHGQILLAGDRLIVQAENGTVVLVEPSPEKLIERGRIAALSSRTWNNPALAGRMLVVRNDREAVCYELPPPE